MADCECALNCTHDYCFLSIFLLLMSPWLLRVFSLEKRIEEYEIIFNKSDFHISKRLFRTLENVVWNNTWEKYSEFDTSRDVCKLLLLQLKFKVFIDLLLDWMITRRYILDFLDTRLFRFPIFTFCHIFSLCMLACFHSWRVVTRRKIMGIFGEKLFGETET